MDRIGHYDVGEVLGEGGIGRVYAGFDTVLQREVAIKSLRPELLTDSNFVARFRAEATSLARLNHPNITTVHALVSEGRSLYMIMERVRGETLEDVIKRRDGPLGVQESLAIIAQAADGLSYAHSMGVIHRDIKPANLMLTSDGVVKIMDFGIARARGSQRLTRDGSIVGTLAYMAPEQLRGEPGDERSDLYSLAIVLYELLSGAAPFSAATDYDLMQAQIHSRPGSLSAFAPGIAGRVERTLMQALAKKPDQRFASVREFKQALGASASPLEASLAFDRAGRTASRIGLTMGRLSWRNPLLVGAAVVMVGLLAWGVWALISESGPPSVALEERAAPKAGPPTAAVPAGSAGPVFTSSRPGTASPNSIVLPPPRAGSSSPPVVLQRQ
jgi:serine/threonine protein kinase